jgi:hypothetical protein
MAANTKMTNTISFEIGKAEDGALTVTPCIDGTPLTTSIAEFELSNGYTDPAGGYGGLIPTAFNAGPLVPFFRGHGDKRGMSDKDGEIWVLGCQCGEVGCWPLMASVTRVPGGYRWSAFRQPHRPERNYDAFGPFVFGEMQYERAVRELALAVKRVAGQRGS